MGLKTPAPRITAQVALPSSGGTARAGIAASSRLRFRLAPSQARLGAGGEDALAAAPHVPDRSGGISLVTSALTGAAPSIGLLIAARLLQGVAGGMLIPQNSGLIQQLFRGAEPLASCCWHC